MAVDIGHYFTLQYPYSLLGGRPSSLPSSANPASATSGTLPVICDGNLAQPKKAMSSLRNVAPSGVRAVFKKLTFRQSF